MKIRHTAKWADETCVLRKKTLWRLFVKDCLEKLSGLRRKQPKMRWSSWWDSNDLFSRKRGQLRMWRIDSGRQAAAGIRNATGYGVCTRHRNLYQSLINTIHTWYHTRLIRIVSDTMRARCNVSARPHSVLANQQLFSFSLSLLLLFY